MLADFTGILVILIIALVMAAALMAIQMTDALSDMQTLMFQHSEQVRKVVDLLVPLLAEVSPPE